MKFTLSWLREHLDTAASVDTIAETLTRIGLEVEGVYDPAAKLAAFRVARIIGADRHPQADKLQLLLVDAGDGPVQVVCGAPNARAGMLGVFGPPGAVVPASGMELKVSNIRGVESNGMMCSVRELELGDEHDGIIELPADAPVGMSYADYAGLADPVFDVAITPNRQDCMGVRGIARDLAAAGLGTLIPLETAYRCGIGPVAGEGPAPDVRIEDVEGCPAFYAQGVAAVTNGDGPGWMTRRLRAIGQKPISALVDITNFVMIDLGRPLHVYDRAKLSGGLVARKARAGETVLALNGKTYALDDTTTVIADDRQVHDIGGIMGGEHCGVSADTKDVLIECAYFDPASIARAGQKLGLTSDARQRFERGVDPAFLDDGLAIATRLVLDHCGGTASSVARVGQPPAHPAPIAYDPLRAKTLGGLAIAPARQRRILESLGFAISDEWIVDPPTWRRDVDGSADLVEEVLRIVGLEHIPSTALPRAAGVARPTATRAQLTERRLRRAAAARGLDEAITWSFIPEAQATAFGGAYAVVANPISADMKAMRPSLVPGLIAAARRNADRGADSIRLFEIGRRYLAEGERPTAGILLSGSRSPRHWQTGRAQSFDAFDVKAEVLALLEAAGAPVANLRLLGDAGPTWHPGRSARLGLGAKIVLASFGELHPRLANALDAPPATVAAEIYLDAIPAPRSVSRGRPAFTPPTLQALTRDFAFLVPDDCTADSLVRAIQGADRSAISSVRLFDRFDSDAGLSLAVEVTLQPSERSFTDAEIEVISTNIVSAAGKLGARLRG